MRFIVVVETDDIEKMPKSASELYDFFYGVSDGQTEAEISVEEQS